MAQEEGKIQKKIIDNLTENGFFVVKLMQTNKSGIPDLLAVKGLHTLWVEVKTLTGKTSAIQDYRIKELKKHNQHVFVVYGYDDFLDKYKTYTEL